MKFKYIRSLDKNLIFSDDFSQHLIPWITDPPLNLYIFLSNDTNEQPLFTYPVNHIDNLNDLQSTLINYLFPAEYYKNEDNPYKKLWRNSHLLKFYYDSENQPYWRNILNHAISVPLNTAFWNKDYIIKKDDEIMYQSPDLKFIQKTTPFNTFRHIPNIDTKIIYDKEGQYLHYFKNYNLTKMKKRSRGDKKRKNYILIHQKKNKWEVRSNERSKIYELKKLINECKIKKIKTIYILDTSTLNYLKEQLNLLSISTNIYFRKQTLSRIWLNDQKIHIKLINDIMPLSKEEIIEIWNIEKTDVLDIWWEAIQKYQDWILKVLKVDITNSTTIPHLAILGWKNTLEKNDIPILPIGSDLEQDIRKAYYGGFSEIYKPEVTDGYMYDVNSLYPYIMQNCEIPVGNFTRTDMKSFWIWPTGFVKATVTVPKMEKGLLPYKSSGNSLWAPYGKWTGWFTSEELKRAKEQEKNIKIEILETIQSENTRIIFKDYIDRLNKYKEEKNQHKALKKITKLLMNSLIGAIGYNQKNITHYQSKDENKTYNLAKREESGQINYYQKSEKQYINVGLAAWVNSLARIYMSSFRRDPHTIYTNVDSIITTKKLPEKWVSENKIGLFKLVTKIKKAIIINKFKKIIETEKDPIDWKLYEYELYNNKDKLINREKIWDKDNKWIGTTNRNIKETSKK